MNNLDNLVLFFKEDLYIKKLIAALIPKEEDLYSKDNCMKYYDKLYSSYKELKDSFFIIDKAFNFGMGDLLTDFFGRVEKMLITSDYSPSNLKKIYQDIFTDMDEGLIESVKKECVGYYSYSNVYSLINTCNTFNELLHVFHSYIVNNENMYHNNALISTNSSKLRGGLSISLYGDVNDNSLITNYGKMLYEKFAKDYDLENVDIVALPKNNKMLIMARDRGHALTLEMDFVGQEIEVNYFIPKVCNLEMVNNLKGVHKIQKGNKTASGSFITREETFVNEVFDFISKVPTDDDMVFDYDFSTFNR